MAEIGAERLDGVETVEQKRVGKEPLEREPVELEPVERESVEQESVEQESVERESVEPEPNGRSSATKNKLVTSCLICGGLAFTIWILFKIFASTENPVTFQENRCTWDAVICPQGWKRIQNNCFFLSEQERTWRESQANCYMAYQGSLFMFNSQNEVEFLMNYMGTSSYWIGLRKQNGNKYWMQANGNVLSNRFILEGNGSCAFIFKKGISSANCDEKKKHICSKKGVCP